MVRLYRLMLWICLLLCTAAAAAEEAPGRLPACTNEAQVEVFLQMPYLEDVGVLAASAESGQIRYVSQNEVLDPMFCAEYWCSAEPGSELDLTARSALGRSFDGHASTMCTRAAYSMALSYLGVDVTPGDMSLMMNARLLQDPYDDVTAALGGVERVQYTKRSFESMLAAYEADEGYSPIYLYFRKPNGINHAVLVVGRADREGYYLVVDPATHLENDENVRVYRMRFNMYYDEIINSTYRAEHRGARVLELQQWRLTDDDE